MRKLPSHACVSEGRNNKTLELKQIGKKAMYRMKILAGNNLPVGGLGQNSRIRIPQMLIASHVVVPG